MSIGKDTLLWLAGQAQMWLVLLGAVCCFVALWFSNWPQNGIVLLISRVGIIWYLSSSLCVIHCPSIIINWSALYFSSSQSICLPAMFMSSWLYFKAFGLNWLYVIFLLVCDWYIMQLILWYHFALFQRNVTITGLVCSGVHTSKQKFATTNNKNSIWATCNM